MNRQRIIVIVLFVILGVVLLYYFGTSSDNKIKYQWRETYRTSSDQPYGTKFIRELLESYRPESKFYINEKKTLKKLLDSTSANLNTDYVFIGQSIYLYDDDADALVNFIRAGNDAFIACLDAPHNILERVYFKECNVPIQYISPVELDSITARFFHDTLATESGYTYRYRYGPNDYPYYWRHVDGGVFCDSTKSLVPLGYFGNTKVNFIKIPVEKGNLYLHCNPLLFTNYFLTDEKKIEYVSAVFSHLKGKDIIWDEYSKVQLSGSQQNPHDSPLYYILQQPSLKYAWWLLLITIMLYVLFAAKRKQRVIPVLESKSNTSLEYVNLISTLHYQNANHLDMARKKMKYFLFFVRSRYGISTDSITDLQIVKLAEKSKMNVQDVQIIFDQYRFIETKFADNIEANRLLNLYYAIENFYQKCK
jgi:hypothetical protein